jgi:hypothetical protein
MKFDTIEKVTLLFLVIFVLSKYMNNKYTNDVKTFMKNNPKLSAEPSNSPKRQELNALTGSQNRYGFIAIISLVLTILSGLGSIAHQLF